MSSAESVRVQYLPPWTEEDERALEESRRRPPRPPRRPPKGRKGRRCVTRTVSEGTLRRWNLTKASLKIIANSVRTGRTTIAGAARQIGCSRSTASRLFAGSYRAQ